MKFYRSKIWILLIVLLNLSGTHALAEEKTPESFQGLIAGGFTFGGDELLKIRYNNGQSEELTAGGLLDLKLGFIYNADEHLSFQSTIGYHFDTLTASNGDGDFSRLPIDLLGFYNFGKHRVGGGLTIHNNSKYDARSREIFLDESAEFDSLNGLVLEYGYKTSDQAILGLRYVDLDYEVTKYNGIPIINGPKFDGSHVGLYLYLLF